MEQTSIASISPCKHNAGNMSKRYYNHLISAVKSHTDELLTLCKEDNDLSHTIILRDLHTNYGNEFAELAQSLSLHDDVSGEGSRAIQCPGESTSHHAAGERSFNVNAPIFNPSVQPHRPDGELGFFTPCPTHWTDPGSVDQTHYRVWNPAPIVHSWPHFHVPSHGSPLVYQSSFGAGAPQYTQYLQYTNALDHHHYQDALPRSRRTKVRETKKEKTATPLNSIETRPRKVHGPQHVAAQKPDGSRKEESREMLSETAIPDTTKSWGQIKEPAEAQPALNIISNLEDFPELSCDQQKETAKRNRLRFPKLKFQGKEKFIITGLYKKYEGPGTDSSSLNYTHKYQRQKKSLPSLMEMTLQPPKTQVNLYTRDRSMYEKVPEEVSDEDDGWKMVKPRFNKNRDNLKQYSVKENLRAVYSCKACQSTYRRCYESSNLNKNLNIRRNPRFTSGQYGSPRNNCTKETNPTHVLDLHYKNMLVSPHDTHRSGKLNNEEHSSAAKNDRVAFVSPKMVSNTSDIVRGGEVLNMVSNNNTPIPPNLDSNCVRELDTKNQDLDGGVCDNDTIGASTHLMSLFLDEEFSVHNNFPTLSTTVSSGSIVDNEYESNTDSQNNIDLSGELSVDDETTLNDDIPVVEDAQDMHEEFMKYLNCSTWPTQMDEIDKFESMIAGNNPSDPVLMYPSVSVEQFTEFIQRHPDEAQAFRREITFKLKKIGETENKQQQAYEKRLELLKCKTAKVRGFVQKVKDVQLAQDKLALKRKHQIDEKLRKAEENRKNYLSTIRRKAHDEEEKLKEIAFINELEAQNRRHDSLALRQENEERLQVIQDERQRRNEEKAAKEAAAEERRRVLEVERQAKLLKIAEARKMKEETIGRKQQERATLRLETVLQKAREREERLLARDAAQRASAEELQRRIRQKQEDSARRHEENIELIRQKALEVGLHRTLEESASTNIASVSKADEQIHTELEKQPESAETQKLRSMKKKKLRKLRVRLTHRASEFMKSYPLADEQFVFSKALADVEPHNPNTAEVLRSLNALKDVLKKSFPNEVKLYEKFSSARGFHLLQHIIKKYVCLSGIPTLDSQDIQVVSSVVEILTHAVVDGDNLRYFIHSNGVMAIIDLLRVFIGLERTDQSTQIVASILSIITFVLDNAPEISNEDQNMRSCLEDLSRYIITCGVIENVVSKMRDVVREETVKHMFIVPCGVAFFTSLVNSRYRSSELLNSLVSTDVFGTIPLLYESLQNIGNSDDALPSYFIPILNLLLAFADIDVLKFQDALGDDGMALQVRAIASNLLCYGKGKQFHHLLQPVILLVGYFALKNVKNQTLLQSGQQPTVLQHLVTVPLVYFFDPEYSEYLFPTLYVCSHNNPTNRAIVENDLNFNTLDTYVTSDKGRSNNMIALFNKLEER